MELDTWVIKKLFKRIAHKLYYGKIYQEGYHRKMPWIHVDFEIGIKQKKQGFGVDFEPEDVCEKEDIARLKKGKTPDERQKIYEQFSFSETMFHEGIRYGLTYAFDIYKKETGYTKGLYVKVLSIGGIISSQNEEFAYIAAKILWKALGFTPQKDVYFDEATHKFVFPDAKELVPIGRFTRNDVIKKYNQLGYDGLDDALAGYDARFKAYHDL